MHIDAATRIELSRGLITTRWGETSQVLRYVEFERVRDAVQRFVLALARFESAVLCGHVCTRCGECCRREDILVTAQEIFRLARQVGVSDAEFRERYLRPAPTWNSEDGLLRTVAGRCVFLDNGADGRTTRCTVYEQRPDSCRAFLPTSAVCVKDPHKLVESLSLVCVEGSRVNVTTDANVRHDLQAEGRPWQPELNALVAALAEVDEKREDPFTQLGNRLKGVLDGLRDDFKAEPGSGAAYRQLMEARGVLEELGRQIEITAADAPQRNALVEALWGQVLDLDAMVAAAPFVEEAPAAAATSEATPAALEPPPPPATGARLVGITVFPERAVASVVHGTQSGQASLPYDTFPSLIPHARDLMESLVRWESPEIAAALEEADPPCFRCGECCRVYHVEIVPSDIERLAWNLGLSEADFVERYTVPGRFSWNPGHRILQKVDYQERKQCVFLEHRADGFFYCGVHAFKPEVCAGYPPTNKLCRRYNDGQYWTRQVRNVHWLFFEGFRAWLCTAHTLAQNRPPLPVDLRRNSQVLSSAARLGHQVLECLQAVASAAP